MPPPALVSVACVLQYTAPDVAVLPHISLSVSAFLDMSVRLSLEKAAASQSLRLFRRVLTRLQESTPPIDEFLMVDYLSKSMAAAVKYGSLSIAQQIHDIHPGKLHCTPLSIAATNGDIVMVQWITENRRDDWRCVPCLAERDPEIEVLEDPPQCCLAETITCALAAKKFAVNKWLVEHGYHGPADCLRHAGNSAARGGDLNAVKWLHDLNAPYTFSNRAIDDAALGGYADVVAFLLTHRSEGYSGLALQFATIGGHDEILELLQSPAHQHLCSGGPPTRNQWLAAYARAGRFDLVRRELQQSAELSTKSLDTPMMIACSLGDLDAVKELVAMGATTVGLRGAADCGHLHIFQWAHELGFVGFDASVLNVAATHGHLGIVQWFHQHHSGAFTSAVMTDAAIKGHLEIVQWLHFNRTEGCTYVAMDGAASAGHLHVVQWLHAHRTEGCTTRAMDGAANHGHQDVVNWLHQHRTEGCTTSAMDDAATNGDLALVIWLHQHRTEGCTTEAMDRAPLHVVQWLHYHRTEGCTANAMGLAAERGDLPKLQFLHAVRRKGCSVHVVVDATRGGHLYVLQWLRHHFPRSFDLARVSNAARTLPKSHPIVHWLKSLQ